jgi:hypothetical protein
MRSGEPIDVPPYFCTIKAIAVVCQLEKSEFYPIVATTKTSRPTITISAFELFPRINVGAIILE